MAIRINFVSQFDNRGIKAAQREIAAVGKNISRALDVAVIGGLAAATTGLVSAVKAASNYAAEFEGVNQVFGEAAKSVQAFAETAAKTAGLSATEALQSAKVFGLFAKSAGLSGQSAADFSTTLVQLAGDLGSFNDVPTADALAAIQSGLQGQAEPLRKFGIFLTDDALKAEYLAQTGQKVVGSLSAQQKMMASYGLIMKQTTIQQGDFTKYGDTMGNSLKTLTKTFEDLSAQIGMQLVPVIEQVLPTVQAMIPVIGQKLKDAVASVDWKAFFDAIIRGFGFIIDNFDKIVTFVGVVWALTKAFAAIEIATKLAAVAMGIFTGTLALNPIMLAVGAIGLLVAGVIALDDALKNMDNNALANKSTAAATRAGQAAYEAYLRTAKRTQTNTGPGSILPSEMIAAEKARQDAYNKALRPAVDETKRLLARQTKAGGTTPGIPTFTTPAATSSASAKAKEALKSFKQDLKELTSGFQSLTQASSNLGQYEQSVVDTFNDINKKLAEGVANKTIGTKGLSTLKNTLNSYNDLLSRKAKERDEIIKKRSLAEALIEDVKSTLTGTGNLASLLDTQSKQVTTSVTKIIDGFTVTTKRTVDEVIGAKGVVGRLKEVVAKTKVFAGQLSDLKKAGLDPDLFKQIVEAGPDVGSQLAKEILDGGADSVVALNDTFAQLKEVSASVAEQTAVVMYNNGVEVAGGLVAGLKSQEQAIIDAAKALADAFNAAYQANIMALEVPSAPTVAPKSTGTTTNVTNKITVKASPVNTKATGQAVYSTLSKYAQANLTSGGVLLRGGR